MPDRRRLLSAVAGRAMLVSLVFALTAALSSCSAFVPPPSPTPQNIAGVWANGSARIAFNSDGTFTMVGVPRYTVFTTDENWRRADSPTRDGKGEWTIESDAVRLETEGVGGEELFFDSADGQLVLEFGLQLGSGDPRCFQFAKEGSKIQPLGPDNCYIRP